MHDDTGNANAASTFNVVTEGDIGGIGDFGDSLVATPDGLFSFEADLDQGSNGAAVFALESSVRDEAFFGNEDIVVGNEFGLLSRVENNTIRFNLTPSGTDCGQVRNGASAFAFRWSVDAARCFRDGVTSAEVSNVGTPGGTLHLFQNLRHTYLDRRVLAHELSHRVRRGGPLHSASVRPKREPPRDVPCRSSKPFCAHTRRGHFAARVAIWQRGVDRPRHRTGSTPARASRTHAPARLWGWFRVDPTGQPLHLDRARWSFAGCLDDRTYALEAWVHPDNLENEGPARVFQYGQGNDEVSIMLGQDDDDDWEVRAGVEDGNSSAERRTDRGWHP